jgi:hypothetical protein
MAARPSSILQRGAPHPSLEWRGLSHECTHGSSEERGRRSARAERAIRSSWRSASIGNITSDPMGQTRQSLPVRQREQRPLPLSAHLVPKPRGTHWDALGNRGHRRGTESLFLSRACVGNPSTSACPAHDVRRGSTLGASTDSLHRSLLVNPGYLPVHSPRGAIGGSDRPAGRGRREVRAAGRRLRNRERHVIHRGPRREQVTERMPLRWAKRRPDSVRRMRQRRR